MYLIVKLDPLGMGKRQVIDYVWNVITKAPDGLEYGDVEVVSVVTATPKRLARVGEEMKGGK